MKRTHSEDLQFLRDFHGRFQDTTSHRQVEWFAIVLMGVFFPALIFALICLFPPMTLAHNLFFAAMILGSFLTGAQVWRERAVEYEFTGDEVIERRRRRIKHRVLISDITETRVTIRTLVLKTNHSKIIIQIFPSLREAIQKKAANLSDAERQEIETVKKDIIPRMNRRKWIAGIAAVLLIYGSIVLINHLNRYLIHVH
jgi:hypothetical protein